MALILTISPRDTICLTTPDGDHVEVKATRAGPHSDRVKVSIDAPDTVDIRRSDKPEFDTGDRSGYACDTM